MKSPLFEQVRWIAAPHRDGENAHSRSPHLRREFTIPKPLQSASLTITALGLYECEINGQRVGERIFAPGWTDYNHRVQYQSHDVTKLLREGKNVIGVILGDGWCVGFVGWAGRGLYQKHPSLLAQLHLIFSDGSECFVRSDEAWKTQYGPILSNDLLMGESYDARLNLPGWSKTGFDDSEWAPVVAVTAPEIQLSPSLDPGVQRQETLQPVPDGAGKRMPNGALLFDLGQNFAGRVRIKIRAASGRTITIRHSEILEQDGTPYYENLRSARATDVYTCAGNELEIWEPRFTFHGFRYVEVAGLHAEDAFSLEGVVLHSELPPVGRFSCSSSLLNQLNHNIEWGLKSNFLEVPTDCPQRDERLGWTGDAQVFIRTACFYRDVRKFFHKWTRDLRDAQMPNGAIPSVIPVDPRVFLHDGGPAWSDATIICPWTIYRCYGDTEILRDHYASMQKYLHYLLHIHSINNIRCHPDLSIFSGFGDWLALDGSGQTKGNTPHDLIGTAFLAYDLQLMRQIAEVLGQDSDAIEYAQLHLEVRTAFQRRFMTAEGLLASGTQTSYVLALHFDLLPEELRPAAARQLVRLIEANQYHIGTGFVGTPYILFALEKFGYLDVAYRLLEQEEFPSWLFPVKNGATTIWERWDGWSPHRGFQNKGMNSFNHYAYGAVGEWMVRSVAGLDLDSSVPGYRKIVFRPRPGGSLTHAGASLRTPQGTASIRWEKHSEILHLFVEIPKGSTGRLDLPEGLQAKVQTELPPGKHTFQFPSLYIED